MAQKTTRPSGSLKALVDAGKTPSLVIGAVERWLLAQPEDTSRRTDVLHPSEIVKDDWCHRASWFLLKGATPPPKNISPKLQRVFNQGHRIHDYWQEVFSDMDRLWGNWECTTCGGLIALNSMRPSHCLYCGFSNNIKYAEVSVYSEEHRIQGKADGILVGFKDEPLLLEIKSIGEGTFRFEDLSGWIEAGNDFKQAWANLKSPFLTHILQAQVYMKLLELMSVGTMQTYPTKALFLYESKVDQDVKEFVVPKSDFGITEIFDNATRIVAAVKANEELACNISETGSCKKCEAFNDYSFEG